MDNVFTLVFKKLLLNLNFYKFTYVVNTFTEPHYC